MALWFLECQFANACVMCEEIFRCQIIVLTDLSKSVAAPFILTTTASSQRQLVQWQKSNCFSSLFIRTVESETQEIKLRQGPILEQQGHSCSSRGREGFELWAQIVFQPHFCNRDLDKYNRGKGKSKHLRTVHEWQPLDSCSPERDTS